MRRYPDWPTRLARFLRGAEGRRFVWGASDCVLFAGNAVQAMTGRDLVASFRGRYGDRRAALRLLRREGAGGLEQTATAILGPPLPTPLLAWRGDVALIPSHRGPGLGIVVGAWIAAPAERGLGRLPLTAAQRAWRV